MPSSESTCDFQFRLQLLMERKFHSSTSALAQLRQLSNLVPPPATAGGVSMGKAKSTTASKSKTNVSDCCICTSNSALNRDYVTLRLKLSLFQVSFPSQSAKHSSSHLARTHFTTNASVERFSNITQVSPVHSADRSMTLRQTSRSSWLTMPPSNGRNHQMRLFSPQLPVRMRLVWPI